MNPTIMFRFTESGDIGDACQRAIVIALLGKHNPTKQGCEVNVYNPFRHVEGLSLHGESGKYGLAVWNEADQKYWTIQVEI